VALTCTQCRLPASEDIEIPSRVEMNEPRRISPAALVDVRPCSVETIVCIPDKFCNCDRGCYISEPLEKLRLPQQAQADTLLVWRARSAQETGARISYDLQGEQLALRVTPNADGTDFYSGSVIR
jgi:hypothetical protein